MNLDHLIMMLGLAAYAVSAILYLVAFPKARKYRQSIVPVAFGAFCLATVAMTTALGSAYFCWFGANCTNSVFAGLMLSTIISWLTIVAYFGSKMRLLGTFVAPIATLILLIEFFTTPAGGHTLSVVPTSLIKFHIAMAVIGEAFAILACGIAILYLMQQRLLKTKQLNLLQSIAPPLAKLDFALFGCLWSGFIFITIGLVTGAASIVMYNAANGSSFTWKILWAMAVWGWYLTILIAKTVFNVSGRRIAQMCLFGFLLLALCFFGLYPWRFRA